MLIVVEELPLPREFVVFLGRLFSACGLEFALIDFAGGSDTLG
jgi:hypothetical protein